MSEPRNQHWLPQFYLRRFAIPGYGDKQKAKIWTLDVTTGDVKWRKIRDVAAVEFLYSHVKSDGTRCFQIEKKLADLENLIARLYPRIADGYPDLKSAWGIKKLTALFIASTILRHPDVQNTMQEVHNQFVKLYEAAANDSDVNPRGLRAERRAGRLS